jgi:antitoxin ParD1/3/4
MTQAKTQTLSLGAHWNHFIEGNLSQGRYASASEMVRDALRLLEERDANSKLEALRCALRDGEESGDAGLLDMEAIRREAKQEAGLQK